MTLISALAETCLTRFAAPELEAETAAVALVGFTFNRSPPTAVMATPAEAEAVSKEPPISAAPDTTIAAVPETERTRLAAQAAKVVAGA